MRQIKNIFLFSVFLLISSISLFAQYTWQAQVSGTNNNLYSVFFTTNGFNAPIQGWATGTGGTIRTTTDYGSNWTGQTSGTTQTLYEVFFISQNEGWISGGNGTILHTIDAGLNWTPQTSGSTDVLWCIFFSSTLKGWTVGANGTILTTVDGGLNWTPQTSGTLGNLWAIKMINDTTGWICGDNGLILKTIDGGTNWITQNSGVTSVLWSLSTIPCSTNELFASGNGGVIVHTTDGGANWNPEVSGTGLFIHWISFENPMCMGWTVGQNGEIRSSSDFGNSWSANTSNTTQSLRSVFMTVPLDLLGWAVGDAGTIRVLQWPLGIRESEKEQITISPNPSNGNFQFDLGNSFSNGTIEITDVLGNTVTQLTTDNRQLTIDLSDQSNGIYFYKIISEDKTISTGKLIVQH